MTLHTHGMAAYACPIWISISGPVTGTIDIRNEDDRLTTAISSSSPPPKNKKARRMAGLSSREAALGCDRAEERRIRNLLERHIGFECDTNIPDSAGHLFLLHAKFGEFTREAGQCCGFLVLGFTP
jgi:hypothetical protein